MYVSTSGNLGNEWSISNYTEKTRMATGTRGHSTCELPRQHAINRIALRPHTRSSPQSM